MRHPLRSTIMRVVTYTTEDTDSGFNAEQITLAEKLQAYKTIVDAINKKTILEQDYSTEEKLEDENTKQNAEIEYLDARLALANKINELFPQVQTDPDVEIYFLILPDNVDYYFDVIFVYA